MELNAERRGLRTKHLRGRLGIFAAGGVAGTCAAKLAPLHAVLFFAVLALTVGAWDYWSRWKETRRRMDESKFRIAALNAAALEQLHRSSTARDKPRDG